MQLTERALPPIRVLDSNHLYINNYLVDTVLMRRTLEENQCAGHQEWQDFLFLKTRVAAFASREIDSNLIWWLQQGIAIMTGRRRRLFYIPDEPFIISCNYPFSRVADGRVMSTRWAIKSELSHQQISTRWCTPHGEPMSGKTIVTGG